MGIRTELRIDGDECKSCSSLLYKSGQEVSRRQSIDAGMELTVVKLLCLQCGTATEIAYWAELMPTERMRQMMRSHRELRSNTARFPRAQPFHVR